MAVCMLVLVRNVEPVWADAVSIVDALPEERSGLPRDGTVV